MNKREGKPTQEAQELDWKLEGYVCASLHRVAILGCSDCDEASLWPQWNIEQILVYIWQAIGGEDSNPKEYPYSNFAESEGGKMLRRQIKGLLDSHAAKERLAEAKWWEHLAGDSHDAEDEPCLYCERIAALEKAVNG